MNRYRTVTATVIVVIIGAIAVLSIWRAAPGRVAGREADPQEAAKGRRFIARFDSLCECRLYPVVWRSGSFTRTAFDESRIEWTLTLSSSDWNRRSRESKIDLATRLHTAFCAVRAQAGGDAEKARLTIKDEADETLVRCSAETGTRIYK